MGLIWYCYGYLIFCERLLNNIYGFGNITYRICLQVKNARELYNIISNSYKKRISWGFFQSLLFTTERNFKSCKMIGWERICSSTWRCKLSTWDFLAQFYKWLPAKRVSNHLLHTIEKLLLLDCLLWSYFSQNFKLKTP